MLQVSVKQFKYIYPTANNSLSDAPTCMKTHESKYINMNIR